MTPTEHAPATVATAEEVHQGWHELKLRMSQMEAEAKALELESKALRLLLERVIEHRQKSHGELVLLLTGLVSKLPINDMGVMVSKLMEHNAHVTEVCAVLGKGSPEAALPQPGILRALEQSKRDLTVALKPAVEELIRLDTPLESDLLNSLVTQPELFYSSKTVRANRCFVKGQVMRERVIREFGEEALIFFNDLTTDPKRNPRPKLEEIAMGFKDDFDALLQQHSTLLPDKRAALSALHQKVQRSKAATGEARAQRVAFQKMSFLLELLHYYENQNTEPPDVYFAQRLPALVEQLVVTPAQDTLDEKLIQQAEALLNFVVKPEHRQMIVNNVGKGGGTGATVKHVMKLRADKVPDQEQAITDFVRHLIPAQKPPRPETAVALLRLIHPAMQPLVVRAIMSSDRIRKDEAQALGRDLGSALGLKGLEEETKPPSAAQPERDAEGAWGKIKALISRRAEPNVIAAAIRERLHAKFDADELKQSWITLIETDAISLIRTFCQLPYLPDGSTDPIAQPVMETYVSRLTHEKYAATYGKVVNSLRNMFKANPQSPTLHNFMAMVRWVDVAAANKLSLDIGMPAPAH